MIMIIIMIFPGVGTDPAPQTHCTRHPDANHIPKRVKRRHPERIGNAKRPHTNIGHIRSTDFQGSGALKLTVLLAIASI